MLQAELVAPEEGTLPVQILKAGLHTLYVKFDGDGVPHHRAEFEGLRVKVDARELALGRCRYVAHPADRSRRKEDPPQLGDGRIVFLDELYDFSALVRNGRVFELERRMDQLPVLFGRKKEVRPAFREYVAETVYDLQVYRSILDEIDRNLAEEPPEVRADVHEVVSEREYPRFRTLFDRQLEGLAEQVRDFSQEEHERHGFYLRKHAWDVIRASEFLLRTNLKPRGYAGDSAMMRMAYENAFRGPTLFSRFMHLHPLQTPAADAVRDRVRLVSTRLARISEEAPAGPLRVMSVASGPAWELHALAENPDLMRRLHLTLLDQDEEAHQEAQSLAGALGMQLGFPLHVQYVQESVRTMLRSKRLSDGDDRYRFIYSMGLFDYLTTPVARVVLHKLYDRLEPGGELVVGNFHVGNRTRLYMEYWMDWVLLHRTEEEMRYLATGLPHARVEILFEDTGSQMFLCVRKEA